MFLLRRTRDAIAHQQARSLSIEPDRMKILGDGRIQPSHRGRRLGGSVAQPAYRARTHIVHGARDEELALIREGRQ
jgi:hypothetical protein